MTAEDTTHITGKLSPDQIGEAIRHKKFGTDMREAIAQAFEYMQGFYEKVNEAFTELSNLKQLHTKDVSDLNQRFDSLNNHIQTVEDQHNRDIEDINSHLSRIDDQLSQHTEEIKDLRNDLTTQMKEVNQRLDTIEQAIFGTDTIEITSPGGADNSDIPMIEINTKDRKDNN